MKQAKAFAPSHITGFFQIFDQQKDALHKGSRGAGVSLSRGIETVVKVQKARENSVHVRINNSVSGSAQVSRHVVSIFLSRFEELGGFQIDVEHHVEVPIGAGFGTSGAAALSLALALNEVFGLSMSRTQVAQLAHVAEVECKTGLGTVIAEAFGGLEIRVEAGAPGVGKIECVPVPKDVAVACLVFGPLSTREYLADESIRTRINDFDGEMIDRLVENPTTESFMRISREFAEHVGLITDRVREVLDSTDKTGVVCSMPMFGESVFTLAEPEKLELVLEVFRRQASNEEIIISKIDSKGARLLPWTI